MHWTYEAAKLDEDLEQGDIIAPTRDLHSQVLEKVHPHFTNAKYLAFMITTQSCDLYRREGSPSAQYISIAPIRSLLQVWPKIVRGSLREHLGGGFFDKKGEGKATDLLKRIVDQNEQALGLFYLHPDAEVRIGDPSVAYLRVTVALRSDHYDVLRSSRTGKLVPSFRAKFGWLVGNLYARAATRDWADNAADKETIKQQIRDLVKGKGVNEAPIWLETDQVRQAKKAKVDFERPKGEVEEELAGLPRITRFDEVVDRAVARATTVLTLSDEDAEKLRRTLKRDGALKSLVHS